MSSKKNHVLATVLIFLLMMFMAMAENTRGVFIPLFKDTFAIKDTEIGTMLTAGSIGYMIFSYIGGSLCQRIGQKKVFIIGIAILAVSLGVLSVSYSFGVFIVGMVLTNCGLSLAGIAANTVVPILFVGMQTLIMNLVHFCYGLGSTIGQRGAGVLVYNGVHWRTIYLAVAIGFILLLIVFFFIKIPESHKHEGNSKISVKEVLSNKLVIFYIISLGFYVFAEMGTGNWLINYVEKSYGFDKSTSSFYLALFFGIFTVGRLLGGFIVERFGYINTIIKFLIIALVLYISGLLLRDKGMIIISISGLFFSITYPTLVSTISKVFKSNSAYITGVVVTLSSGINMIMNLFMGIANDNLGIGISIYMIPISLMTSITFLLLLHRSTKDVLVINKNNLR